MAPALTIEGTILGTVSYMSPEQAEGKKVDTRSDIFSFGSILYELLTGKRAFQNDTMLSTLSAILRDEPAPVGEIAEDTRGELERIINRCLRKDPDRRWHNMADLKIALQELREESTTGSSIGMKTPPRRQQAQPPKNGWVLGAGIVVVIAAAGWFTFGDKLRPSATPPPPPPVASTGTDKPSAFPPPADAVLTNDQIIEMVKSGMKKSLIVSHIRNSKTNFSFSTPEMIRLSKESVPEDVIEAMRNSLGSPIAGGSSGNTPATPGTAPPTPGSIPATPAAGATAAKAILAAGEKVPLLLTADVLFSTAEGHSRLEFTVAEDIKSGGQVLIAKGAPAIGSLVDAEKRKLFGRGGKITIRLESVKAVDGQTINLRPTPVVVSASKAKDKDVALAKDSAFVGHIDHEASIAPGIAPK
jgi:serine/threonine-protein kinase